MKINTEFIYPPIPIRCFDWMAWVGDMDEDSLIAHGQTEQEAIDNLLLALADDE